MSQLWLQACGEELAPRSCAVGSHGSAQENNGRQTKKVLQSLKLTNSNGMNGHMAKQWKAHQKGLAKIETYEFKWNEWTHGKKKTHREMVFLVMTV